MILLDGRELDPVHGGFFLTRQLAVIGERDLRGLALLQCFREVQRDAKIRCDRDAGTWRPASITIRDTFIALFNSNDTDDVASCRDEADLNVPRDRLVFGVDLRIDDVMLYVDTSAAILRRGWSCPKTATQPS